MDKAYLNARDIGQVAKTARYTLELTQSQLAEKVGVGRRFISDLEKGKPTAEIQKVFDVLHALGLEVRIEKATR